MIRPLLIALPFAALASTSAPAAGAPNCDVPAPGAHISFGFSIGEFSESDRNDFNLMRLRRMGVDATRAEMWGGCIRAYVRTPSGEEMQFFHPDTFERVY